MDINEIERRVAENPQSIVGSLFLCPHCNQKLKVIRVSPGINAGYDPSGKWNDFVYVQFSDGEWARFWIREYPDIPFMDKRK